MRVLVLALTDLGHIQGTDGGKTDMPATSATSALFSDGPQVVEVSMGIAFTCFTCQEHGVFDAPWLCLSNIAMDVFALLCVMDENQGTMVS